MANFIAVGEYPKVVPGPLTLAALQIYVQGFIAFVELKSGDLMVTNEMSNLASYNKTASSIAGFEVFGDVVICSSSEVA